MVLVCKIIIAVILLQTLRYKFSGHPESKAIFRKMALLGLPEQYGRIGTGVLELVAAVFLFIPSMLTVGLVMVIGLMAGALMSHVTKLGFKGNNLPLAVSGAVALVLALVLLLM